MPGLQRTKRNVRNRSNRVRGLLSIGIVVLGVASFIAFHLHLSSSLAEKSGASSAVARALHRSRGAVTPARRDNHGQRRHGDGGGRRVFLRYDDAGPKPIPGTARSHALPNAVPRARQIPRAWADNETYHVSQRTNASTLSLGGRRGDQAPYNWKHDYRTDFRTLYLYNPSILPLSDHGGSDEEDPDALSREDWRALTGGDPRVKYVATYRAYLGCNCFGTKPKHRRVLMKAGEQVSYLAVALLDEALDVIDGTDVLFDLNAGPAARAYASQPMEDCRLFLLRGALFLLCNEELKRVRITRTAHNDQRRPPLSQSGPHSSPPATSSKLPYTYPNIHGDGLEVTVEAQIGNVGEGKNFNVFRTATASSNKITDGASVSHVPPLMQYEYYLQTHPAPHKYRRMNIGTDLTSWNVFRNASSPHRSWNAPETAPGALPRPTFDTPDARHNLTLCEDPKALWCSHPRTLPFFEVREDHGTACCVRVTLPPGALGGGRRSRGGGDADDADDAAGTEVLVGIAHQKLSQVTNFWLRDVHGRYRDFAYDQFVSRFVAYDVSRRPFAVVARSGWFCLGFAAAEEGSAALGDHRGSTLAGTNLHARLDLFNRTYACPGIHFASGFAEAADDRSRAVIGYGVNDCHPRMFFVEKEVIARLLTMTG